MKVLFQLVLLALAAFAAASAPPQKPVIVSFPDHTPPSVIQKAKEAIKEAGGIITHEYSIIKAFAAKAPASALQMIETSDSEYNIVIEEDQVVSIDEDGS